MNPSELHAISSRLSLRPPQKTSLEILAHLCDALKLEKGANLTEEFKAVQAKFPEVKEFIDFERNFPSFCFALATGVGKTRLMGAFIAYLHKAEKINHFLILAPNLTIYNKLMKDFTPNTPKYVFQGISEFAIEPPEIITGENYESGRGVRRGDLFGGIHINIFNISKITSKETTKGATKSNVPRFRRLQEYIGESYFDYLSKLDDLVILMDESHRYRASAGMEAINELKPILGLELTATPQVEREKSNPEAFKNIIYSYPLSEAMKDGFVKEPAVATRENFNATNLSEAQLEQIKMEDGILIHENTKVELEIYSCDNNAPIVKPFILIIAKDTEHADDLMKRIENQSFFDGRYKGKVITVHSNQKGEEKDETVEQLMNVEKPENPTEIVIHVNMLKEGWDVTNLYTIIPLRTANSKTLVEQSIGRGLRLPYGKRTGVGAVDRLTIVSHDRFQEIVDYANSNESLIRYGLKTVYINPAEKMERITSTPKILQYISETTPSPNSSKFVPNQKKLFDSPEKRVIATKTMELIKKFECLPRSANLEEPEIQKQIVEEIKASITPSQLKIEGTEEKVNIAKIVEETIKLRNELSIDIPRITIQPKGNVTRGYKPFNLNLSQVNYQAVDEKILIQSLQNHEQHRLTEGAGFSIEEKPENYLVKGLIDFDDVCYDEQAELLYELAGQVLKHLRSYLKNEEEVLNVLGHRQRDLVELIHLQMQGNYEEKATTYEVTVNKGFTTLKPQNYSASSTEKERDFRQPVEAKKDIRKRLFTEFEKCLYQIQKFDSDSERRFSVILEQEKEVLKWFRPVKGDIQIYHSNDASYEPDFIVETREKKYICEVKKAEDLDDKEVQAKAISAVKWCTNATKHELEYGGKPWVYLLIPHDIIMDNKTLKGLEALYPCSPEK
ncbi:MAG: DEAD/DEAH box helicase family protein [Planctomycetota bacterium]